jgi:NAD(P)H-hydrate epimerase
MKLFRCDQIRKIDEYTVANEPVASVDLMERAAQQLFIWIREHFDKSYRFVVFAGPGNNGGDGLALARILSSGGYTVAVYYVDFTEKRSADWEINRHRLEAETSLKLINISKGDSFPVLSKEDIVIDAIFGSGLTRAAEDLAAEIVSHINKSGCDVISVDIPSGLFGEDNSKNLNGTIIEADYTLSFQFPKISFMFEENNKYTGQWIVLPIGLHCDAIRNITSNYFLLEKSDIKPKLAVRSRFDHKGVFGHGLLIAGSYGRIGASILAAGAALRAGVGLLTCNIPACGYQIVQSSVPEAMVITDLMNDCISSAIITELYSAIGVGPGLGTAPETQKALFDVLSSCKKPIVLDADALNILSMNKEWLSLIPSESILTPHPKEFERLFGKSIDSYERLQKQIVFSEKFNCIIVCKGANTTLSTPSGDVFFNSTGNPGMATGGSGDVLTGIILSLLAQGYSPVNAAVTGVYLHGLAGDIAAGESCYESIIASDIINCIGKAFKEIRRNGVMA